VRVGPARSPLKIADADRRGDEQQGDQRGRRRAEQSIKFVPTVEHAVS